jgi:hypothetical protein
MRSLCSCFAPFVISGMVCVGLAAQDDSRPDLTGK